MGSPSFEGFHVRKQESNTFNTRIVCIVSCSNKKITEQNKTGKMKNIAKLAYI